MSASISRGVSYASTEQITNQKLHNLVDNATISGIANSELDQITTADKVSGSAITDLVFFDDALVSFGNAQVYF